MPLIVLTANRKTETVPVRKSNTVHAGPTPATATRVQAESHCRTVMSDDFPASEHITTDDYDHKMMELQPEMAAAWL